MFSEKSISRFLSAKPLNTGRNKYDNKKAIIRAIKASKIDSPINCLISCFLPAPTIFLSPTSLALVADLAVERLI